MRTRTWLCALLNPQEPGSSGPRAGLSGVNGPGRWYGAERPLLLLLPIGSWHMDHFILRHWHSVGKALGGGDLREVSANWHSCLLIDCPLVFPSLLHFVF